MSDYNTQVIEEFRANGDNVVVFASFAGAPSNPVWFATDRQIPAVLLERR